MSELQHTQQPLAEATEPSVVSPALQSESAIEAPVAPVEQSKSVVDGSALDNTQATQSTPAVAAPVEESKLDSAIATPAAEKTVEPITEGLLGYKGPGLLKSLVPSKKEFWLSDAPVAPQHMDLYMRGEKSEIAHPVVAWASETGRGLLFFNKKGETSKTRPHSVLPLYEATDLKKVSPHEVAFEVHGHKHTLKAANDTERDGWYVSLERAMEMGKADKATVRASETYIAELEKLSVSPHLASSTMAVGGVAGAGAGVGAAAASRSKSRTKKSTDLDNPRRTASDEDMDDKRKSRSASRGILNKLKGKKDEVETKREIKKEEKEEVKEEKAIDKEEKKIEKEEKKVEKEELKAAKHGDGVPLVGGAVLDAPSTAERVLAAPVEETHGDAAATALPIGGATAISEEKAARPNKRGSIFGRMGSGWGNIKSPGKEKEFKDAELKPQVPPKDIGVSETAPQIPEAAIGSSDAAPVINTEESVPAEAAKEQLDPVAPATQQKGFLSGLPFLNKRNRSVSPSTNVAETPLQRDETPAVPVKDATAVEPTTLATEEPINSVAETNPINESVNTTTEKVAGPVTARPGLTETTSPNGNKRQSVLGNLGRRASTLLKGMQTPRKENVAPTTTGPVSEAEEAVETTPATAEKSIVNGETLASDVEQPHAVTGDVVSEASHTQHSNPIVATSA